MSDILNFILELISTGPWGLVFMFFVTILIFGLIFFNDRTKQEFKLGKFERKLELVEQKSDTADETNSKKNHYIGKFHHRMVKLAYANTNLQEVRKHILLEVEENWGEVEKIDDVHKEKVEVIKVQITELDKETPPEGFGAKILNLWRK